MTEDDAWADAMRVAALLALDPGLGGAVVRAAPGPVRDAWLSGLRAMLPLGAPWRRLPPGVDDSRLLGGLDLAAALGEGRSVLQRGLLAEADGGAVIVPMAERLEPTVGSRLAAVLDAGAVVLERDGLADRLESRFLLIALDEGIGAEEQPSPALTERLAFHIDLTGIGVRDIGAGALGAGEVAAARAVLPAVASMAAEDAEALCAAALAMGVDSLRGPLLAARAAAAAAALDGRDAVDPDDLMLAARLVLTPRATRRPDEPDAAESAPPPPDVSEPDAGDKDDLAAEPGSLDDIVLAAALAALPETIEALWAAQARSRSARQAARGAGRAKPTAERGRSRGVRPGVPNDAAGLNIVETLKAAAPWRRIRPAPRPGGARLRIGRDDLRLRRFQQRAESTVIFAVDASGSSALHRLAEAKGAVELLLAEAYVRRTQVALLAFRGTEAELLLPPTRSLARARRALADLAGGGATPLASALERSFALAIAERAKGRTPLLVVLTDGRGNIALDGAAFRTRAETDATTAARRLRIDGITAAVIDTSPRPRGDGERLAMAMGARFAPLPYVEAGAVRDVVRDLGAGAV